MSSRPQPATCAQEPSFLDLRASQHVLEPRACDDSGASSLDGRIAVGASRIGSTLQPPQRLPNRPTVHTEPAPDLRLAQAELLKMFGLRRDPLINRAWFDFEDGYFDRQSSCGSNSSRSRPPETLNSPPPWAAFLVSGSADGNLTSGCWRAPRAASRRSQPMTGRRLQPSAQRRRS